MANEQMLMGLLKTPSQVRRDEQQRMMEESMARSQQMLTRGGTTALPGIISAYGAQAAQRGAQAGAGLLRGISGGIGSMVGGETGQRIADLGISAEERQARAQQAALQGFDPNNLQSMKQALMKLQQSGAPAQAIMQLQNVIAAKEKEVQATVQQNRAKNAALDYINRVNPDLASSLQDATPEAIAKATESVSKQLEPVKVGNSIVALDPQTNEYRAVYSEPKEPESEYVLLTDSELNTLREQGVNLPKGPVYQRNKKTGQITTVVGREPRPAFASPPQGYQYVFTTNPDGSEAVSAEPIPGTPQAELVRKQQEAVKAGRRNTKSALMDIINPAIDEAIRIAEDPQNWATGKSGATIEALGKATGGIASAGTARLALQEQLTTVRANIGFDKLQRMRDESPTGGALGQVALGELYALQSSIAPLNPNMKSEELVDGLEKVRASYQRAAIAVANDLTDEQLMQEGLGALIPFRTQTRNEDGTYEPLNEPSETEDVSEFDISVLPQDVRDGWDQLDDETKQALMEAYR